MVADMAKETANQAKKGTAIVRSGLAESRKAKGFASKAGALAAGAGRYTAHALKGSLRVSAAAVIGPSKSNPASREREEISRMLERMPLDWAAQLAVACRELGAAGVPYPPHNPTPEQALLALNLNNRGEASSEVRPGQLQAGGVPVPAAVRDAAMEGLRLSYRNNYGGYRFIGIARAIQLAISPTISREALNRIRMYFDRKTKQDRMSVDYAERKGKRYWSWLNWGGDPAAKWSKSSRFAELMQAERKNPTEPYLVAWDVDGTSLFYGPFDHKEQAREAAALMPERNQGYEFSLVPASRAPHWKPNRWDREEVIRLQTILGMRKNPARKNPVKVTIRERRRGDVSLPGKHERLMRSPAAARVIEEKGAKIKPQIVYEVSSARYRPPDIVKSADPDVLVLVATPYIVDNIYVPGEIPGNRATKVSPFTLHTILHRFGDVIMATLGEFVGEHFYPNQGYLLRDVILTPEADQLLTRAGHALKDVTDILRTKARIAPFDWFPACVNTKACREGWVDEADQALAELVPVHLLYGGARFMPTPAALVPDPAVRGELDAAAARTAVLLGQFIDMMLHTLRGHRVAI